MIGAIDVIILNLVPLHMHQLLVSYTSTTLVLPHLSELG